MSTEVNMSLEDRLKCSLSYDPDTGKLYRKCKEGLREAFSSSTSDGYKDGFMFGKSYLSHRVAWLLYYGSWPDGQIDHINGVKDDNRITNLRVVSNMENQRNTKRRSDNNSGVTGVGWHKHSGKWRSRIRVGGSLVHIGLFACLGQAIKARREAEKLYGFHPNHGKR